MRKKSLISLVGLLFSSLLHASLLHEIPLSSVNIDLHDSERLQRGAKVYMNYCSGCHSLRYMRYNRMAKDLGLTTFDGEVDEDLLYSNLIFTHAKIYDPIQISMPMVDARQWFGTVPPDLSVSARQRGADWIYTYLKSFYEDSSRPFGTNNLLIPGVAMPNILEPLRGKVIKREQTTDDTDTDVELSPLLLVEKGEMTANEFDSTLEDLVNFLVYVGEPAKLVRYRMGVGVMIFLLVFLVVAYRLKVVYWKKLKK